MTRPQYWTAWSDDMDYDFDLQGDAFGKAVDDFARGHDGRFDDDFDDQPEEYRNGYQQGWTYAVKQDVQSRYPGYDNPHSMPPAWFDPADAGETW